MFRSFPALVRRAGATSRSRPTPASASAVAKTADSWTQVIDEQTKQPYWWNRQTNETTAVGAPKPSGEVAPPPPTQMAVGGRGGLMGAVVDGLAFGVGSSMAHRMVDSVMGPRQMEVVHTNEAAPSSDNSANADDGGGFSGGGSNNGFFGGGDDSGGGDGGGGWGDW